MCSYSCDSKAGFVVGALLGWAFWSIPVTAQEVALISGRGFEPRELKEGSHPKKGTRIVADSQTVVVLVRTWKAQGGHCEEWVVLRGKSYDVETSQPNTCPDRGKGDELARAMQGESLLAFVTAYDNPKADGLSNNIEAKQLQADIDRFRKQTDENSRTRDHRTTQTTTRRSDVARGEPIVVKARKNSAVESTVQSPSALLRCHMIEGDENQVSLSLERRGEKVVGSIVQARTREKQKVSGVWKKGNLSFATSGDAYGGTGYFGFITKDEVGTIRIVGVYGSRHSDWYSHAWRAGCDEVVQ